MNRTPPQPFSIIAGLFQALSESNGLYLQRHDLRVVAAAVDCCFDGIQEAFKSGHHCIGMALFATLQHLGRVGCPAAVRIQPLTSALRVRRTV
jgi:hypothetical protein